MSAVVISGDSSGSISLQAPAVAGTTTLTLPTTSGTLATQGVGQGQTWTDVLSSRSLSTTYTNSTGKPIMLSIRANATSGSAIFTLTVDSVVVGYSSSATGSPVPCSLLGAVIPVGSTYSVTSTNMNTVTHWFELR